MTTTDYTISPARYAGRWNGKPQMAIRCTPTDGYKTRAMYLAEALKGRWSGRERAYIVSPTKAAKFERLYAEGWDAGLLGNLVAPKTEA
jgi:hypothetical protein